MTGGCRRANRLLSSLLAVLAALPAALSAPPAAAQAAHYAPEVRVSLEPAQVVVGNRIRLRVTVLVPTWFSKPSVYPGFELANAITRLPPDSSFPTSERIRGETWSGIVRDYDLYPQLAATFELGGQTIRVTYADPESRRPVTADVPVPDIRFRATVPDGAESLNPFLGARSLRVERNIEGNLDELAAGDAITMRLRASIDGMPALFLPPLAPEIDVPGIRTYPKEPQLGDATPATRTEMVTYTFTGGGTFELPAVELTWWNTTSQRIERSSTPAVTLMVTGPPAAVTPEVATPAGSGWSLWTLLMLTSLTAAAAAIGVTLIRRLLPGVRRWREARRTAYLRSERYAYQHLQAVLAKSDLSAADLALQAWLERLEPGLSLTTLAARTGQPELAARVDGLYAAAYGPADPRDRADPAAALADVRTQLAVARKRWRSPEQPAIDISLLPPLNPLGAPRR